MTKITYLIPKPSSEGGMTAITKMLYEINYFDNNQFYHFNTSYKSKGKLGRVREFIIRYFSFIRHLIQVRPDAIFVMSNSYLGFYEKCTYCLTARLFFVKSMLNHVGGEFDKFYKKNKFNRVAVRIAIRFPNALLIGSTFWCTYFRTSFPRVKVYNSPNPIIAKDYLAGNPSRMNSKFVVTSLFRLIKEKGVIELMEVIKKICSRREDIEFVIMGGGPMLDTIRLELASHIAKGQVRVLGFVDDQTKIKEICNSNAYLMLTYFDLMPISIMEAMAASKPIISTKVGGIPDLVEDGINGYLFDVGETDAVIEKLEFLIENPEKHREMGVASREKIDAHFDISKITSLHLQYAKELSGNN